MASYALENMEPQHVATAALQAYFNITEHWALNEKQQRILLGQPAESTFNKWKSTKSAKRLDFNTLERISYIVGIHKNLRILLPTERAAFEWVAKPNDALMFHGDTALSRMLVGRVSDLYEVRRYLDRELG